MELFPYPPRPNQAEFVRSVEKTTREKGHLVLESGTGSGKTVCALSGALQTALATGKKVLYLTRTNSQEKQVILELRRINEKAPVFGVALQGRQGTCPLVRRDKELSAGTPEELSKICRDKRRKVLEDRPGGCRFFKGLQDLDMEQFLEHCKRTLPTAEELIDHCDSLNICPHEVMKELAREARVVAAPYAYFFVPFIRNSLLDWMDCPIEDVLLIVDEAHNLPDYTREIESFQLSRYVLEAVLKEVEEYGDPEIGKGVSLNDVRTECSKLLEEAVRDYLIDEDGLIPPSFLEEGLMTAFTCTSRALQAMAKLIMEQGEIIRESRFAQGRLPRSYTFSLGSFLSYWSTLDEECFVKLIVGGENPCLKAYCIDPVVTTSALLNCGGSVHMSGTLAPLNEYRDSIGLPYDSATITLPSPFPKENRRVFYVEDVSTKYEEMQSSPEMVEVMEDHVVQVCNGVKRNTVVFFPSYSLMDRFLEDGVSRRISRKVYLEERGMPQLELMDVVTRFKKLEENGQVLFAVMGGRISEGIDFPEDELELAIVVGIPYPRPTAKQRALMHYYELKFRRGWDYAVKGPAIRKMQQSIGRLIRTERDVGAALVLDRRITQFADRLDLVPTEHPLQDIQAFFRERGR
ncbi:MAG TPA: ATP-dependent DNA helicase [Methanomassiliicoccales archaeon]|nr:ATP-dependent DNA helicase [Methanomassiliicoccales archaeon]